MKIYIIMENLGAYEGERIEEIFATKEQAQEYMEFLCKLDEKNEYYIEEYVVETDAKKIIQKREEQER